ncbi:hypothetical protein CEXT_223361 [Caerostris extrusa]|uniref:Uncharacterized protein n=1 Tax=Caerostris extrusa TaxID=172846 RepID=A0AAV4YAV3_CAEEX|nr:hypothetical protein CEXT_223361 [Caerostris extrusa]
MKFVVLHLSLLVAYACAEYAQGLSGQFPKLEDVQLKVKEAEGRSLGDLLAVPEAKSGYGFGGESYGLGHGHGGGGGGGGGGYGHGGGHGGGHGHGHGKEF